MKILQSRKTERRDLEIAGVVEDVGIVLVGDDLEAIGPSKVLLDELHVGEDLELAARWESGDGSRG